MPATKTFDDAGCCLLAAYLIILLLHSNSHIRGLHTLYRAPPQRGDPPKRYRSHDHRHTHIHEHTNEGYQTIHTTSEEDHAPRVTVLANAALCVFFCLRWATHGLYLSVRPSVGPGVFGGLRIFTSLFANVSGAHTRETGHHHYCCLLC